MITSLKFEHPEFQVLAGREWLVTNGIGGYASSSLCGTNTRRYHGLLVAAFQPPTDRRVLVSRLEEKVIAGRKEFYLSTNAYPRTIHPEGYQYLTSFTRVPFPKAVFTNGLHTITKTVFMRYGHNTTVVEYHNAGEESVLMEFNPLLVCRDYHHLFRQHPTWIFKPVVGPDKIVEIIPGHDQPSIWMRFTSGTFYADPHWYRQFEYYQERERGLDFTEDALSIGKISVMLAPWESIAIIFGASREEIEGDPVQWKAEEEQRLKQLTPKGKSKWISDLMVSGDQFLVKRKSTDTHTIIAGYHWFTDWGRDTMIAMRGLVIATGKQEMAKSILATFLNHLHRGMIPNHFPDQGQQPEYNTLDATLWMFVALYEYAMTFNDLEFVASIFNKLTEIIDSHIQGTRFNIHVTPEGLLFGGEHGTQLTWMDAKVDGHVVTPRAGCPVEINALWYNALSIYVYFGHALGRDVSTYLDRLTGLRESFRHAFINAQGYLSDVVMPGQWRDDAIRPNQIYAISLPFTPLTNDEARQVLETVYAHLYTDYGLRSLSPMHPDFKPEFTGNPWQRDHAYHQGTVWAFLWGEYAMAHLLVNHFSPEACAWVKEHAKKLEHHFYLEDGLHAISENFDGGQPGQGKGCIQQAWSIGMTLLALLQADK